MQLERIALDHDRSDVYLQAYWLENSAEFQTGQRRPVVIVCPGGGYLATSDREAEPIALRFAAHGYHACVLRYRVRTPLPAPMLDLARAILAVRERAAERFVDPDQLILCGFSAGGHLAAALGVLWDQPLLYAPLGVTPARIKPNALVLAYAVIDPEVIRLPPLVVDPQTGRPQLDLGLLSAAFGDPQPPAAAVDPYRLDWHVSASTAPAFIWHTADDPVVPAANALRFASALARHGVPYELHIFASGEHGLALADETTAIDGRLIDLPNQAWLPLALTWLKRRRA